MTVRTAVLDALTSGIDRAILIAEHTGIPLNQVYVRLAELKRDGVLKSVRVPKVKPKRSRNPNEQRKRYRFKAWCGDWML